MYQEPLKRKREVHKFSDGSVYVVTEKFSFMPAVPAEEVIDIFEATDEEVEQLKKNPKDDKLIKKIQRRHLDKQKSTK